ncbi:YceI family protein [Mucilaginibacter sp. JRF]|uniref:YceI family protein n=1 Tax=Mucilaginibacter sp. JRF TaxID=2780088 RepID=UPI0018822A75|nr:YceI family protein [Mucilaginibacter sp. JRF]MBE9583339.1 YceI family protein [Mucilaginibacter sp. JRF]
MTKLFILLALCLQIRTNTQIAAQTKTNGSVVYWKGTKLRGIGSHEGILKFKSIKLDTRQDHLTGSHFVIDMRSLQVTDIPAHETVPLNALTKHLHEELETATYPMASFVITKVKGQQISGNLTIRNITKSISFFYRQTNGQWEATFNISRKDFGIGKNASWLEKKLVDDLIQLNVYITLNK